MPERGIIKAFQHIRGHLVDIADRPDFRVHPLHILRPFPGRQIELVAHQNIARTAVDILALDQPVDRLIV